MTFPRLTLTCARTTSGLSCQSALRYDGELMESSSDLAMPVTAADQAEIQWLLEERPRLRGVAAERVAQRIRSRVDHIGRLLGEMVCGPAHNGKRIAQLVEKKARQLEVRIVEQSLPWIPWECLRVPGLETPLACVAFSFFRSSLVQSEVSKASDTEIPRILFVVARPGGEDDVSFRSVAGRVVTALRNEGSAELRIDLLRPPTYDTLRETLARAKSAGRPYRVVHFDGHGAYRPAPFNPNKQRGYLVFEKENTDSDYVDGATIGRLLHENGVETLLLNACRSGFAGGEGDSQGLPTATPFESLAEEIAAAGIGSVLAMGFDVYVSVAASLIAQPYLGLSSGLRLGEAVALSRQELLARQTNCEWLIPVLYGHDSSPWTKRRSRLPTLTIGPSHVTPLTPYVYDPHGSASARSAEKPFVGYDDILLRLERTFQRERVVELNGLAGSGKSAMAAEFGRWIAFTQALSCDGPSPAEESSRDSLAHQVARKLDGNLAVLVIDASRCASITELLRVAAERIGNLAGQMVQGLPEMTNERTLEWIQNATRGVSLFWILEDADATPIAETKVEKGPSLEAVVAVLSGSSSRVLVTARSVALPNVPHIAIPGLEPDEINDLVHVSGFQIATAPGVLEQWLDWAQGLPGLTLEVLRVLHEGGTGSLSEERARLKKIRTGSEEAEGLAEGCGIAKLTYPAEIRDERACIALFLFHGGISGDRWRFYASMLAMKTKDHFGGKRYEFGQLLNELQGAARRGLVCALSETWLLVHPLAAFASGDHFYGYIRSMGGANPSRAYIGLIFGILKSTFCQVSILPKIVGTAAAGVPLHVVRRADRQSDLFAAELGLDNRWWELAIQLLRLVGDSLLALHREPEWEEILLETLTAFLNDTGEKQNPVVQNWPRLLVQLLEEQMARMGDAASADRLRAAADFLNANDTIGESVDKDGKQIIDYALLRQISTLLEQGKRLRAQNSAEAVSILNQALDLAAGEYEGLQRGKIHLELALVHGNVTAVRDLKEYETHAREAIAIGERFGPLGKSILMRGKNSLGIALVSQLQEESSLPKEDLPEGDRQKREAKMREAAAVLRFVQETAASLSLRASASNGIGQLYGLQGNLTQAATEFLRAAEAFAATGQLHDAGMVYTNAALAFYRDNRLADAASAAEEGLPLISNQENPPANLVEAMRQIIRERQDNRD